MKAKIYYRRPDPTLPHNKWKYTVKTIEVSKNEPNQILQKFIIIPPLHNIPMLLISSAAVMTISGMIAATVLLV